MNFPRLVATKIWMAPLAVAALAAYAADVRAQGAFPAPLPNSASPAQPTNANSPFPPVNGASNSQQPAASGQRSASPFPPVNGGGGGGGASSPFPPAGGASASPTAFPSGGAAPIAGTGGGLPQPPSAGGGGGDPGAACVREFQPLRDETEKRGKAIKAASDRKASAQEACGLIKNFSAAELKLMKYVSANSARCGIPPQILDQMKQGRATTDKLLAQVCNAAKQQQAGPAAPAGPSLSEALGSVALPEANTSPRRSGGTTFDTLSGNVLAR